jgi:hypothetical protein
VPPEPDAGVVDRLRDLAATVVTCPREDGELGDPAYLRLREELDRGALPFTTQGPENGLAIEGGQTLGYVSVATGILDDETYDWRAVVEGMLLTGGRPLVVSEIALTRAHALAVAATGIEVDHTGSSGLAGVPELRRSGEIGDDERVAVLFTGRQR